MKINKLLICAFVVAFAQSVLSQPILTDVATNFAVDDYFIMVESSYFNVGASGANQTWNFSAADSQYVEYYKVIDPDSVPTAGNFCNADVVLHRYGVYDAYYYWATTATSSEWIASYYMNDQKVFSNTEKFFVYPFTYNDSYTDSLSFSGMYNGVMHYTRGSFSRIADGYGTLITPAGTFPNVLRTHSIEIWIDSTSWGGTGDTSVYEHYSWWLPGIHYNLALVGYSSSGSSSWNYASYMSNPLFTSIKEYNNASLSLYPNPASDFITVKSENPEFSAEDILLFSSDGKRVDVPVSRSGNELKIDVSVLPAGIYFLRILMDDMNFHSEIISVTH